MPWLRMVPPASCPPESQTALQFTSYFILTGIDPLTYFLDQQNTMLRSTCGTLNLSIKLLCCISAILDSEAISDVVGIGRRFVPLFTNIEKKLHSSDDYSDLSQA